MGNEEARRGGQNVEGVCPGLLFLSPGAVHRPDSSRMGILTSVDFWKQNHVMQLGRYMDIYN